MLFTDPGLFTYSVLALEVIPLHVRAGTVVAPEAVRVPPTPTFPRVESVETVRDPVTLLVPLIDSPPPLFAIWPDEVNCVQVTAASVELPVTFKVPVNVEPPVTARPEDAVSVPATLAFPEDTISPLVEIRPAEVSVPAMLAFPEDTFSPFDVVTLSLIHI